MNMDYKDIKKLMDDMGESNLDSLEIEFPDGVKISMKKNWGGNNIVYSNQSGVIEASAPMTVPTVVPNVENGLVNVDVQEDVRVVKSPMVGTFYEASAPDKEPFVKVGDKVQKGQVLCIIEAMKLMNEIESEYDGEVVEICVKNGSMVEYGMPLFKIR